MQFLYFSNNAMTCVHVHVHCIYLQHSGIEHNTQRLHKRQGGDRNPDLIRCRLNVIADYKFYDAVTDSSDDENTRVIQATASIRNFIGSVS